MIRLSGVFEVASGFVPAPVLCSPLQVLVVDRVNGPADVLFDADRLLMGSAVEITLVAEPGDALHALDAWAFDLLVVGLDAQRPLQMALLPHLRARAPQTPLLVISRAMSDETAQRARRFGAMDALELPQCAADLRALIARLWQEYQLAA